jgi:hypothetical protein
MQKLFQEREKNGNREGVNKNYRAPPRRRSSKERVLQNTPA